MSEKIKSSDERTQELRKEFHKLQDEEIAKIGVGEEADPDLLAFRSEWVDALGAEELEPLHKLLMLQRGVQNGYQFEKDEVQSAFYAVTNLGNIVDRRCHNFLREQKLEENDATKHSFLESDYVALFWRLISQKFFKFWRDNPEALGILRAIQEENARQAAHSGK